MHVIVSKQRFERERDHAMTYDKEALIQPSDVLCEYFCCIYLLSSDCRLCFMMPLELHINLLGLPYKLMEKSTMNS